MRPDDEGAFLASLKLEQPVAFAQSEFEPDRILRIGDSWIFAGVHELCSSQDAAGGSETAALLSLSAATTNSVLDFVQAPSPPCKGMTGSTTN
jgi:hypothetical protein